MDENDSRQAQIAEIVLGVVTANNPLNQLIEIKSGQLAFLDGYEVSDKITQRVLVTVINSDPLAATLATQPEAVVIPTAVEEDASFASFYTRHRLQFENTIAIPKRRKN